MAEAAKKTFKPSERLLSMKFMQRSIEQEELKKLEKEQKRMISEAEWVLEYPEEQIQKPKIRVDQQPSFLAFTETPNVGRQSFQKFNKRVEKVSDEAITQQRQEREDVNTRKAGISDSEMVDRLQTVRARSKKPSDKKRKATDGRSTPKKMKTTETGFIKPA